MEAKLITEIDTLKTTSHGTFLVRMKHVHLPHLHPFFSSCMSDLVRTIDLRHVAEEIQDTTAVAPLVVVPRYQLDKVLVQADAGLGVEDG